MKSIPKRQIAYSDQDTVELDGENKSDSYFYLVQYITKAEYSRAFLTGVWRFQEK